MRRLMLLLIMGCSGVGPAVELPGSGPGIGFDDLRFSPRLGRVLAPAGRSGRLALVDPATREVTAIEGFSASDAFDGGHDFGVTSAEDTGAVLLATDRTARELLVIDAGARAIVGRTPLAAGPDYVRWVAPTAEIWVTEPSAEQIEIFSLPAGETAPQPVARISIRGGPESLIIDGTRRRAYTHLWEGATVAIDLDRREPVATWDNGCDGSRGIALDEARGFLFAGCREGRATLLDVTTGARRAEVWPVDGVDVIDYDPVLHHLYLAGQIDATLAIVGVDSRGEMAVLGLEHTAIGASCVVSDRRGHAWVCDPQGGRLLVRDDAFPAITR